MDDRINKPALGRDAHAPASSATPSPISRPAAQEADCDQEHDFDIVFEFEADEDPAN